jgi:G:T-mismatch repair DNA endonuclease (very short patch repair protein)
MNTSNTIQFIQNSVEIHGNKYDYSKVVYSKSSDKIPIICKIHGEFEQTPASHLQGNGCNYCGKLTSKQKQQFTKEQFIEKSIKVHRNTYDYTKVEYNNNNTKVIIICKEHGDFEQTPQGHLSGRGCIKCANKHQHTTEEWIQLAQQLHGNIYDYSNVKYISANDTICITCKLHGNFEQLPRVHLRPNGCYKCSQKSYSKKQIQWLECISKIKGIQIQHAMNESEYTIPTTNLKADGFCKETNTIYEFHGDFWHGNPKLYNSEHINPVNKKTFGELYQHTIARELQIKELGYNLIVLWEYDWNKLIKTIRYLQQQFRYSKTHK